MFDKDVVPVAYMGAIDLAQLQNTIGLANQVQTAFRFDLRQDRIPIEAERYLLANGGYDLECAVTDLARAGQIKGPLAIFTGLAFGDVDTASQPDWLYFADYALAYDPSLAVISTYVWQHLPGVRRLQPFILLQLATLVLSTFGGLEEHDEPQSCMFDYCEDEGQIDLSFHGPGLCPNCERALATKVRSGAITIAQVASARRLFLRGAGRQTCFMIMPFEKSLTRVYDRVGDLLGKLGWSVTRADKLANPGRITDAISEAIWTADLILADLTGNNPNVFYEVGIAHTLGKEVIFLTQNPEIPIDVVLERAVFYKMTEPSLDGLEATLREIASSRLTRS